MKHLYLIGAVLIVLTASCKTKEYIYKYKGKYLYNTVVKNEAGKDSVIIKGIIKQAYDNEPLPFASVNIDGSGIELTTDRSGFFRIKIHKGTYRIISRSKNQIIGTKRMYFNGGTETEFIFYMPSTPVK